MRTRKRLRGAPPVVCSAEPSVFGSIRKPKFFVFNVPAPAPKRCGLRTGFPPETLLWHHTIVVWLFFVGERNNPLDRSPLVILTPQMVCFKIRAPRFKTARDNLSRLLKTPPAVFSSRKKISFWSVKEFLSQNRSCVNQCRKNIRRFAKQKFGNLPFFGEPLI